MSAKKQKAILPIGRTAMLMCQILMVRDECCRTADVLVKQEKVDEEELEECARLDDALAEVHRILKATVSGVTLSRLKRRSRTG
jgi:hypothetical protein